MRSEDDSLQGLSAEIDRLVAGDVAELLEQARADASARVRSMLSDAFARSMLDQIREQLSSSSGVTPASEPRAEAASERRPAGELGWYVYGVVPSKFAATLLPSGVDGSHQIEMLSEGRLAALASQVALEQFGEERLREHLADMGWVEAVARAHEEALEQVRSQTTVVPMRMCTVYRSEARVREMLQRESAGLEEAIEHLEGRTEWGVKVFVDFARLAQTAGDENQLLSKTGGPDAGRGKAYMAQKRHERERQERSTEQIEQASRVIHERLSAVANDALVVPLQRPEVSGHEGEMVLNGVYLVQDDVSGQFDRQVAELQTEFGSRGFELELTGPWPAYNFVPGTLGAAW